MRKIIFALTATFFLVIGSTTSSFAWMPGDNPYDPGCNVNVGGNCGRQLDSWNNTWRRLGYPMEPGRGAYGTYVPGNAYIPNGAYGYAGQAVVMQPGYAYGPQGYGYGVPVGQPMGYGVGGVIARTMFVIRHRQMQQAQAAAAMARARTVSQPVPVAAAATLTQSDIALLRSAYKQ